MSRKLVALCLLMLTQCARDPAAGGACNQVEPCGGDVLGAWSLVDACYLSVQQPMVEGCEQATASAETMQPSGGVSFDADTYTFDFSLTMRLVVHLPESCTQRVGMTFACAELGGPLARGQDLVCAEARDGGCDCMAELPITGDDVDVYTLRGDQLSLRGEAFDHCVRGDQLVLNHRIAMEWSTKASMITLLQLTLRRAH